MIRGRWEKSGGHINNQWANNENEQILGPLVSPKHYESKSWNSPIHNKLATSAETANICALRCALKLWSYGFLHSKCVLVARRILYGLHKYELRIMSALCCDWKAKNRRRRRSDGAASRASFSFDRAISANCNRDENFTTSTTFSDQNIYCTSEPSAGNGRLFDVFHSPHFCFGHVLLLQVSCMMTSTIYYWFMSMHNAMANSGLGLRNNLEIPRHFLAHEKMNAKNTTTTQGKRLKELLHRNWKWRWKNA